MIAIKSNSLSYLNVWLLNKQNKKKTFSLLDLDILYMKTDFLLNIITSLLWGND